MAETIQIHFSFRTNTVFNLDKYMLAWDLQYVHPVVVECFAPNTLRRQHVMAEAIKFEAEMLMALDSRSQPLPTHTLMHTNTFCN